MVADTAIVVRKGDPAALAEGILRALEGAGPDPARARQRAEERFGVEAMVAGTIAACRDVLTRS